MSKESLDALERELIAESIGENEVCSVPGCPGDAPIVFADADKRVTLCAGCSDALRQGEIWREEIRAQFRAAVVRVATREELSA